MVYERPPHPFTQKDVDRITARVLENAIRSADPAAPEDEIARWIKILIFILDDASERMLGVLLTPLGLASFADDVVDQIKKAIQDVIGALGDYLENARGPLGIPGGGVF